MEINQKRVLPLDDHCIGNKGVDYKLFSILQSMSYINKEKVRYVPKQHPIHGSITRSALLELYNKTPSQPNEVISLKTLGRKLTLIKAIGMVEETQVINISGEEVPGFILLENYKRFRLVPLETLKFLADTVNSDVIKTYVYLLDKYLWKQLTNEYYSFTLIEIAEEIGFTSGYDGATKKIRNCLHLLSCIDLIHHVEYYTTVGRETPSPRMRLVVANQHYKKINRRYHFDKT